MGYIQQDVREGPSLLFDVSAFLENILHLFSAFKTAFVTRYKTFFFLDLLWVFCCPFDSGWVSTLLTTVSISLSVISYLVFLHCSGVQNEVHSSGLTRVIFH